MGYEERARLVKMKDKSATYHIGCQWGFDARILHFDKDGLILRVNNFSLSCKEE